MSVFGRECFEGWLEILLLCRYLCHRQDLGIEVFELLLEGRDFVLRWMIFPRTLRSRTKGFEVELIQLGSCRLDGVLDQAGTGLSQLTDAFLLIGILCLEFPPQFMEAGKEFVVGVKDIVDDLIHSTGRFSALLSKLRDTGV